MDTASLKELLDRKYREYNNSLFIEPDPVSVPHLFNRKPDIEIAGFLTATLSWGNRKSIIASARRLIRMMDDSPHDFLTGEGNQDFKPFHRFVHRTFNGNDCIFFLQSLRAFYRYHNSLEDIFSGMDKTGAGPAIHLFREVLLQTPHLPRSEKHIADPFKGSPAKRINMFLRWMVRRDDNGVDFGLWKTVSPASLICPLDVHSGRVARKLGLLRRNTNDWKAALELTERLREFDPDDPVKYDFALFGTGLSEHRISDP